MQSTLFVLRVDTVKAINVRQSLSGMPSNGSAIFNGEFQFSDANDLTLDFQPVNDFRDKRCSFSINLNMYVKTWNGSGRLNGLDDYDQAAFALEQT